MVGPGWKKPLFSKEELLSYSISRSFIEKVRDLFKLDDDREAYDYIKSDILPRCTLKNYANQSFLPGGIEADEYGFRIGGESYYCKVGADGNKLVASIHEPNYPLYVNSGETIKPKTRKPKK